MKHEINEKIKQMQEYVLDMSAAWTEAEQVFRKGMRQDAIEELYKVLDDSIEKYYGYDEVEYLDYSGELVLYRYEDVYERTVWTNDSDYPEMIYTSAVLTFKLRENGTLDYWKEYIDKYGDIVHECDPTFEFEEYGVTKQMLDVVASKLRNIKTWS